MNLRPNNLIKFCGLLLLALYIVLCPAYADQYTDQYTYQFISGMKPKKEIREKKDSTETSDSQKATNTKDIKEKETSSTQKITTDSFFNNATFEKFEPQEDSTPFDDSYLEATT